MKQLILNQRAIILDEIIELFPFFIKNLQENNNSKSETMDLHASELEQKFEEREELLELIARRIQGLVQGTIVIEKNGISNIEDNNIVYSIEKIVKKELQVINIDSWLKMFDYLNLEKKGVEDEFRFLIRLIGNIELYHERVFEKDDTLPMPDKIKELKFPIELEKDLILLNKARNDAVHNGKEIYEDDRLLMYDVFFRVLQFLMEFHVKEKVNTLVSNDRDRKIAYKGARVLLTNYMAKKASKNSWEQHQLSNLLIKLFP